MTRCEITELLVAQCAHCVAPNVPTPPDPFDEPAEPARSDDWFPWFWARFPGGCAGCGLHFEAGDRIRANGDGGYLAECCGGEE